ncbi:MAG: DNA-binding response regulator [Cyanobacteria bacterium RYN_339]|nr:DNA-binding response regulator [Cyanobacteria bacterium RYN_339]
MERKRVLVVEDDRDVNTLICRYLGHRDFTCTGAHSAEQCLGELDADSAPDLILIDLELPDLDGAELCRRIHQRADARDVPVLLMTGYQLANQLDRVRAAGAAALLLKPFSPKELLAKVIEMTRVPPAAQAI